MRILYFSRDYTTHDYRFLSALAKTDHQVFYLRLEDGKRQGEDRPIPAEIEQVWLETGVRPFHWLDSPSRALQLRRLIQTIRPQLIHAGPIQSCAFLVALAGFRPLLTMSWGFDLMEDAERSAWWKWVTRYTLARTTFFVSDAEVTRTRAIRYGMRADCSAVFPWGVDLKHFSPLPGSSGTAPTRSPAKKAAGRAKQPTSPKRPFVLFCNRSWEARYGVDVLARAFTRVARERPEARLLLLSGGSMAMPIRQILMQAGAMEYVQMPGQISQADLPRWYRMADLYISPSHVDGSSVSLMEAMGCGLPVLVSDIPANREWVTEGANGWLFHDGDSDDLARKILSIMTQRARLPAIGKAARTRAEQKADWSKNFAVLLKAYDLATQAGG